MESDTVVVPDPAAMVAGVKVAVAPGGSPVADKDTDEGNVVPLAGVRTKP
jgi:hypothetical protein